METHNVADLPPSLLLPDEEPIIVALSAGLRLCIDLGTYRGRSAALMAHGALRIVTIDLFQAGYQRDPPIEADTEEGNADYEEVRHYFATRFPNVEVRQGITWEEAEIFPHKCADLIFVDGSHDYDSLQKDYVAWCKVLKLGGVFLFHDYNDHPDHRDVVRFIDELRANCIQLAWMPLIGQSGSLAAFRKVYEY